MDFSLLGLWSQMGGVAKGVVIILLAMSMYAIGIALERFLTHRRSRVRSLAYLAALQPMLSSVGQMRDATAGGDGQQQWRDAPLARVIAPGIASFLRGLDDLGPGAADPVELELLVNGVTRSMERAKKHEVTALQRGLPVLATISSSAPFVGLFGTVFGIITAFQQMADPSRGGGGGLASVSAGIAEALLTTAVGLAVAIVSVWFYNFLVTRVDDFGGLVDETVGELADRLLEAARHRGVGGDPGSAVGAASTSTSTSTLPARP